MKPRDVYDAPYLRSSKDIYPISYFLDGIDSYNDGLEKQDRVEIREHFNPYIDGTRNASLYSVWYAPTASERPRSAALGLHPEKQAKFLPVFICKTGGRPDYEHYARYITDQKLFLAMLIYLKSMEELEERDHDDIVGIDDDLDDLNTVYCSRINKNDLGPIPHHREAFAKDLRRWGSEMGWPYAPFLGKIDGVFKHGTITLEEKQRQRWKRLQSDAMRLVEVDPECSVVFDLAQAAHGTDEIIEKMMSHIKSLQEKSGVLTD